jgi:hypothetical protein
MENTGEHPHLDSPGDVRVTLPLPFAAAWSVYAGLLVLAVAVIVFSWSRWLVFAGLAASVIALLLIGRRPGVQTAAISGEIVDPGRIGAVVGGVVVAVGGSFASTQGRVGGLICVVLLMLADLIERLERWRRGSRPDSLVRLAGDPRYAVVPIAIGRWRARRKRSPRAH